MLLTVPGLDSQVLDPVSLPATMTMSPRSGSRFTSHLVVFSAEVYQGSHSSDVSKFQDFSVP